MPLNGGGHSIPYHIPQWLGSARDMTGPGKVHPRTRALPRSCLARERGFTLAEVVMSVAVMALLLLGVILTYIQSSYYAEWSGCSLAAQSMSIQAIEQARSAVWDYSIGKNELTNLNLLGWTYNASTRTGSGYSWAVMDLPITGTNTVTATNYVTVRALYLNGQTNPPVQVQLVTVDTVWPRTMYGTKRYFTNHTASYFGPDNRDDTSL
jgi:prepilin-type N-terminal cleavage/methylation domain-containing protein